MAEGAAVEWPVPSLTVVVTYLCFDQLYGLGSVETYGRDYRGQNTQTSSMPLHV